MNKVVSVGICLGFLFGLISYVSTNSIIVGLIILTLTILYFVFVLKKRFDSYESKLSLFYECYHFINNFIVSLSIKGSILSSIENATLGASEDFKDEMEGIEKLNENEKLIYLKKYFQFSSYQLFVDVVLMWCEEGGNILKMSNFLLNNLRIEEEYLSYSEQENKKKLVEFGVLWAFSLAILVALRFALAQFFDLISKTFLYPIGVCFLFFFLLLSIEFLTRRMTKVEIKGWENER